jgi:hypothetical protein
VQFPKNSLEVDYTLILSYDYRFDLILKVEFVVEISQVSVFDLPNFPLIDRKSP